MGKKDFTKAIEACNENGKRLCYDAESCWSSPAGVALAILAQEEYAKAFILNLVNEGIIPWSQGVQLSIRNHECKHLFVLIMDYLASIDEPIGEWEKRLKSGEQVQIPSHVRDAINIYRHEKVGRWEEGGAPCWDEDPNWHKIPKRIGMNKKVDRKKQDSLYVQISKDGEVVKVPNADEKDVEKELKRARDVQDIASGHVINAISYYWEIQNALKWVFSEPEDRQDNQEPVIISET